MGSCTCSRGWWRRAITPASVLPGPCSTGPVTPRGWNGSALPLNPRLTTSGGRAAAAAARARVRAGGPPGRAGRPRRPGHPVDEGRLARGHKGKKAQGVGRGGPAVLRRRAGSPGAPVGQRHSRPARRASGHGRHRQGRDHQARHVGGEPASLRSHRLQAALLRVARLPQAGAPSFRWESLLHGTSRRPSWPHRRWQS
jgi:hypothetical protein